MNLPLKKLRLAAGLLGWAATLAIVAATLVPVDARPHLAEVGANGERFFAYLAAGALLSFAYPRQRWPVLAGVILLAIGLEWLQTWEATRHGRARDALVKCAGAVIGGILSGILDHMATRPRNPV